jgi:hypothetical protein
LYDFFGEGILYRRVQKYEAVADAFTAKDAFINGVPYVILKILHK